MRYKARREENNKPIEWLTDLLNRFIIKAAGGQCIGNVNFTLVSNQDLEKTDYLG